MYITCMLELWQSALCDITESNDANWQKWSSSSKQFCALFLESNSNYINWRLFRELTAQSDYALVQKAAAGVKTSPVVYVADICRFSTSYVTAAAAGARGLVRFRTRMSAKEFKARGRSTATRCAKSTRWLHMCEDEPSGRLTFALSRVHFSLFCTASQILAACLLLLSARSTDEGSKTYMTQRLSMPILVCLHFASTSSMDQKENHCTRGQPMGERVKAI